MAESDLEAAIRGANPRWLAARDELIRGSRLNDSGAPMQPSRIVKDSMITPLLYGGGGSSTAFGIADDPNAPPPQTPTWPDPYPPDTDHTPLPPIDEGVDIVLAAVFGQNVGYPNSYGGFAADQAYLWHHHTDPGPYLLVTAWQFSVGIASTIENITFWRVDIRVKTPPYDGPSMAVLTHSGLSEFFGGAGPYQLYQDDYA